MCACLCVYIVYYTCVCARVFTYIYIHTIVDRAIPKVQLRLRASCWPKQTEPPLRTGLYKHMLDIQIHCQITRN